MSHAFVYREMARPERPAGRSRRAPLVQRASYQTLRAVGGLVDAIGAAADQCGALVQVLAIVALIAIVPLAFIPCRLAAWVRNRAERREGAA